MSIRWGDARPLAGLLFERYDTLDPRTVRLADMRKWVPDLEDFEGRPDEANDDMLRDIQAVWFDLWQSEYGQK